jgi:hypothetical protein
LSSFANRHSWARNCCYIAQKSFIEWNSAKWSESKSAKNPSLSFLWWSLMTFSKILLTNFWKGLVCYFPPHWWPATLNLFVGAWTGSHVFVDVVLFLLFCASRLMSIFFKCLFTEFWPMHCEIWHFILALISALQSDLAVRQKHLHKAYK